MRKNIRHRKGFTLIELLVVIGIIAVLAGIALPIIYRAYKSSQKSRTAADLGAIALALDAYKADFGDYPQVSPAEPDTGFAILGKALVGPYGDGYLPSSPNDDTSDPPAPAGGNGNKIGDCITESSQRRLVTADTAGGGSTYQHVQFDSRDGADGPGFRVRPPIAGVAQGRVYAPYLQPGRVKMQGLAFIDTNDNPILYFSSAGNKGIVTTANSYACVPVAGSKPRWDLRQNISFFRQAGETVDTQAQKGFAGMLFDFNPSNETASTNYDGKIDPGEGPPVDKPYLLWAPGADGLFAPNHNGPGYPNKAAFSGCDDITNFR